MTRRLLLITHRAPDQAGGAAARWRAMRRDLERAGWEVDVVTAPQRQSAQEFNTESGVRRRVRVRSAAMSRLRRLAAPVFRRLRLEPPPLSMLWIPRGVMQTRRALAQGSYSVAL